jgi:hypothetical protein
MKGGSKQEKAWVFNNRAMISSGIDQLLTTIL